LPCHDALLGYKRAAVAKQKKVQDDQAADLGVTAGLWIAVDEPLSPTDADYEDAAPKPLANSKIAVVDRRVD